MSIDIWIKWENLQKIYFIEYFQLQCDQDVTDAKAITVLYSIWPYGKTGLNFL